MNITHAEMVARLMKPKADLNFTPEQCDMIHAILGISGECGELLDAVKKHVIYCKLLDRENIVEELGDMEFYMEHLRKINGITREETIAANMNKLAKRYPNYDYTDGKAQERADKLDDGWIEWNGGVCPCVVGSEVEVRFRNGQIPAVHRAEFWVWRWNNECDDIVAYRIVK